MGKRITWSAALLLWAACGGAEEETFEENVATSEEALTKREASDLVRWVASWWGIHNALVIAGVANHEVPGMNQCNPNFCIGPSTWECPGGIVIGGGDGSCAHGGVGIFQLDRGTYWDTINSYQWNEGIDIRLTQGNTEGGIMHILNDLRVCAQTPFPSNSPDWVVVDWLNSAVPGTANYEVFLTCMASHYNGCGPSCSAHWSVRQKYHQGVQDLLNAYGWGYWYGDCGSGYQTLGGIRDKWLSLGGCDSFLGAPVTNEEGTPDGWGRYNHFAGGSIYWTERTGAHEVHGAIRDHWAWLGWELSWYGYPITDEYAYDGSPWGMPGWVAESEFEHGWISYAFADGSIHEWSK